MAQLTFGMFRENSIMANHARFRATAAALPISAAGSAMILGVGSNSAPALAQAPAPLGLERMCRADSVKATLSGLSIKAEPGRIADMPGPFYADGTRFYPAKGDVPAYCQVTGSYVTNPATGKTANFLATFPENWNGKYLQLGCSSHCGTFAVSNPGMFTVTITNQGLPGDIIRKGYASFSTDQGHTVMTGGTWAIKGSGQVDDDAITDYLWRSSKVLTQFGKQFTKSFYAGVEGRSAEIARSYFSGCSGGGRDALVAASYFPEEFDGIIAGSPYNLGGRAFHLLATSFATLRAPDADISQPQLKLFNSIVMNQCDGLDGVKDGLIQNPAACNFRPERDLPKCRDGETGGQCFTQHQIETISVVLTATTDDRGRMVQPGYSVSELLDSFAPPPPSDPSAAEPWPDSPGSPGALWALGNATLKVFAHRNDPAFHSRSILTFRSGGPGSITDFRGVVPAREVDLVMSSLRSGIGHFPENYTKLIAGNRKLMIWHNLSDDKLTPYMSYNLYNQLAARNGGYAKLQKNVRLFSLPGTAHCSGGGLPVGPGSFDALAAMEGWVEKAKAPNSLKATLYQPTAFSVDYTKPLGRTMPLCAFPQMARYNGKGDVKDGANWSCSPNDKRMLQVGESGRRAGVR